jgi:hypothetical protein
MLFTPFLDLALAATAVSLGMVVAAGYITLGLWRSEERLRTLLSYLLFLPARRPTALVLFTGMVGAYLLAALIVSMAAAMGNLGNAGGAVASVLFLAGSLCLFLLLYRLFRMQTLRPEEQEALRVGHYAMFTQMIGDDRATSDGDVPLHPLVPPGPRGIR